MSFFHVAADVPARAAVLAGVDPATPCRPKKGSSPMCDAYGGVAGSGCRAMSRGVAAMAKFHAALFEQA
jgi:hypothetical protein